MLCLRFDGCAPGVREKALSLLVVASFSVVVPGCPGRSDAPAGGVVGDADAARPHRPLTLTLEYPRHTETVRRPAETCGILAALLESGLADLEDVVPNVQGVPVSPGIRDHLQLGAERWTGSVFVHGDKSDITVMLTLCGPDGACVEHRADGVYEGPHAIAATLLPLAAATLDRQPLPGAVDAWALPQSPDPYAVMIAGRGASIFYGQGEPLDPEDVGDRKRDPITRALYLDPAMPLGQWIAGRRAQTLGKSGRGEFARAAVLRPRSLLFQADAAAALLADGDAEGALAAWQVVEAQQPKDPRFTVARARTAMGLERHALATTMLDGLREGLQDDRTVVELRVQIADATGAGEGHDDLLARWEAAAPEEAEPVRRRLALRVEAGRYREALEFTEVLTARGAREEANRAAMALAVGLREWELAAREAESLGLPEVASDLQIRASIEAEERQLPPGLEQDKEPAARIVEGQWWLSHEAPDRALRIAEALLVTQPWWPEALALAHRAAVGSGRGAEAAAYEARLLLADPAWGRSRAWGGVVAASDGPGASGAPAGGSTPGDGGVVPAGGEVGPSGGDAGEGAAPEARPGAAVDPGETVPEGEAPGAPGATRMPSVGAAGGGASSGTAAAAAASPSALPRGATSMSGVSGPNTAAGSTTSGEQSQLPVL